MNCHVHLLPLQLVVISVVALLLVVLVLGVVVSLLSFLPCHVNVFVIVYFKGYYQNYTYLNLPPNLNKLKTFFLTHAQSLYDVEKRRCDQM